MTSLTRGPLSPGVYWRRRVFVLGLVAALVFVVSGAIRGGGDPPEEVVANQASGTADDPATDPEDEAADDSGDSDDAGDEQTGKRGKKAKASLTPAPELPEPDGQCLDGDVRVTPSVEGAVAGQPVTISLSVQTVVDSACTWRLSPQRLALRITSGSDQIWNSAECAREIPQRDVIVRQVQPTTVDLEWDAQRSSEGCPRETDFARAGYYVVATAALGGEPNESQFRLTNPEPEVITKGGGKQKNSNQGSGAGGETPQSGGATEPDEPDSGSASGNEKKKKRNAG